MITDHALRAAAEARTASLPVPPTTHEAAKLLHELQVHQVELEMQNEALRQSQATLETALRAKSEFLNQITHDFKTPLNSIIGFSEMLQAGLAGPVTPKQKEFAADILASGLRLLKLVDGILTESRNDDATMTP
jgi:two-component system cell cycle sensor histidine kinase PleC